MAPSLNVPLLTAGMLTTGVCMSLWSKYQDMQCVENCNDPNPHNRVFYEQPVWQTLQMFCGEMLCFIPVAYAWLMSSLRPPIQLTSDSEDDTSEPVKPSGKRLRGWRIMLLILPACCDLAGTTLVNVGLLLTPVSIFQMTRGALVLFVGVFSVIFLRRRLALYQWFALVTVMAGVSVVGLSGLLAENKMKEDSLLGHAVTFLTDPDAGPDGTEQAAKVLTGVFFIIFAQLFTATQFVIEEKIMTHYSVEPLVVVGLEGLFGAILIMLLFPILSIPSVSSQTPYFDLPRGWQQMIGNSRVMLSGVIIAFSIGGFNFFGLSVTRRVSSTARSVTDACRTIAIWLVSLGLGWERLLWPVSVVQVAGFALLIYGTFLFNDLVRGPPCIPRSRHIGSVQASTDIDQAEPHLAGAQDEAALSA